MSEVDRKEQVIRLWKKCFDDSDESLLLFFTNVYRDETAVSLEKDGKIVTLLQMLPYTMMWCGEEIPVSYIYAACTDPAERRRGWMRRLLEKTHGIMRRRGFCLSVLIPADDSLFEYYRKYDYTEVFDYSLSVCTFQDVIKRTEKHLPGGYRCTVLKEEDTDSWFSFFDNCQRRRKTGVLHNREGFRNLIMDYALDGDRIFALRKANSGEPLGIAFVSVAPAEIVVEEMTATDDLAESLLLREVMAHFAVEKVTCRKPASLPDARRMGMGMILDRERMIDKWLAYHPDSTFTKTVLMNREIKELTSLLMGYKDREAYMNLMPD